MMPPVQMDLPSHSRELAAIDTVLSRAISAGDPLIAAEYGNTLSNAIARKGIELAKLFHGLRDSWGLFRAAGIEEDFGDFVDAHMVVRGRTAIKYADMYQSVFLSPDVPPEIKQQLEQKPIKSLLLLTAAVREGVLSADQLEEVVIKDHDGIREIVREARGQATNSHTAVYARLVQRDSGNYAKGSLVVFGGEEREPIGFIKLEPQTEAGRKFLARMINVLGLEDIR